MSFKGYYKDLLLIEEYIDNNAFDDEEENQYNNEIPKKEISNKGDFVIRNGKMLFNRVGPVSGQIQTTSKSPSRRGVWAFPFPLFDHFFVSGSFSFPSQMEPKSVNVKKLNQSEKSELQKVKDQKISNIKEIKASVPNFKEIEKTHKDLYYKYLDLLDDIDQIDRMLSQKEPIRLYNYYRLIGKEDEYEKIEKEQPKAHLSDDERKELETRKKHILNAMAALKPKLKNGDDKYHTVDHKYDELTYRLSDIEELLSGEGTNKLKHSLFHGKNFNKVKKFWYNGRIYARFDDNGKIVGAGGSGEWHKFDNVSKYIQAAKKHIIDYSDAKKMGWHDNDKEKPPLQKGVVSGFGNADYRISVDAMEVFIPL